MSQHLRERKYQAVGQLKYRFLTWTHVFRHQRLEDMMRMRCQWRCRQRWLHPRLQPSQSHGLRRLQRRLPQLKAGDWATSEAVGSSGVLGFLASLALPSAGGSPLEMPARSPTE
eukprot:g19182.t1